ncbi:serine/threonine-protein kinase [Streptomyces sp. RTd22]|uniref:serine/threonine-protein kinase n=1 Tax=Streptomyces sp. RTd22 TaxID=1841249 RepID=UPI00099F9510|nr:serine/threonine-protein kinase [Streptomyces sp. RTd22]
MTNADHAVLSPLRPDDPREVAGYRLLAKVGEGGMGSVYLSRTRGNQPVALKVIRREFAQNDDFRRRFEQEVTAARRVQGYHIVPVVDHDTSGELPWLASAYVPGLALDDALGRYGPLPMPAAFQLIGCTAQALHAVHAASVIHRDLKPSNILLSSNGPFVIDFGIARAADATQLTRSGGFIGTPQYMSPEHAFGKPVTAATDIFALGLIAAVVATGRHPYGDGAGISIAAQIANTAQQPPDLSGYPDELRPLLERCLAADPEQRPTPAELAELCRRAAARELRDFSGWLPAPITEEIARRERVAQQPPEPAQPPMPTHTPTQTPTQTPTYAPTYAPAYAPTQAPAPPSHHPVASAPTQAAAYPAPPAPGDSGRGKGRMLAVAGGALALIMVAVAAYVFTQGDDTKGAEQNKADGKHTAQPQHPDKAEKTPSPKASAPSSDAPAPRTAYTPIYQNKTLQLRAPDHFGPTTDFDLDQPKVDVAGGLASDVQDISMFVNEFRAGEAMAKSPGTTPKECEEAVTTDPLEDTLVPSDLIDEQLIAKGDRLCMVTSSGNLAMLKITAVIPPEDDSDIPSYSTSATLWKRGS